jgi:hypothetical protein
MPAFRADYYRRQADICFRLSLTASDDASCAQLFDMAQRYKAKAEAFERRDVTAVFMAQAPSIIGPEQR